MSTEKVSAIFIHHLLINLPIQTLGPSPKGRKVYWCLELIASAENLSGSNL